MVNENIICLIAAAGRGLRFGKEMPKSFYPVDGRTLLARSLQSISLWGGVSRFVIMVPPGWEEEARKVLGSEVPGVKYRILTGGETRRDSVAIGLKTVEDAGLVLVHDACRPIVSTSLIERVVSAAAEHGAAVPALQVTDTLGRLRDEALEGIVPRERVVGIQTPQVFRLEILRKAFEEAGDKAGTFTDEGSLVLAGGFPVRVVEGERWNIKVTVKEDLEIVASFLAGKRLALVDGC